MHILCDEERVVTQLNTQHVSKKITREGLKEKEIF